MKIITLILTLILAAPAAATIMTQDEKDDAYHASLCLSLAGAMGDDEAEFEWRDATTVLMVRHSRDNLQEAYQLGLVTGMAIGKADMWTANKTKDEVRQVYDTTCVE